MKQIKIYKQKQDAMWRGATYLLLLTLNEEHSSIIESLKHIRPAFVNEGFLQIRNLVESGRRPLHYIYSNRHCAEIKWMVNLVVPALKSLSFAEINALSKIVRKMVRQYKRTHKISY